MRKPISKKVRFEVFKRDKFTCQYCGRSAPDVILEVDHITPVAKGGDNSIFNLVTSCFDCNNGKSDRELSDDSHAKKIKSGLDENQEKINQIDMLFEYKKTMIDSDEYELNKFTDYFIESINADISKWNHYIKPLLKKKIRKLLKIYQHELIIEAIDISILRYVNSKQSIYMLDVENAINKVDGIAKNTLLQKNNPHHKEFTLALNGMREEFGYCFDWYKMYSYMEDILYGVDEETVKNSLNHTHFRWWVDNYTMDQIKRKSK